MIKTKLNFETKTILHLEDSFEDAEIIENLLLRSGLKFEIKLVSEFPDFNDAINIVKPDIILSDFDLPGFDGFDALAVAKGVVPDIPFIFVTGAVGEEMAVNAIKSGATDFIMKNNLERLLPAIERALDEKKIADDRKNLFKALTISEERYRTLMENLPIGVFRITFSIPVRFLQANLSAASLLGLNSIEELLDVNAKTFYYDTDDMKSFRKEITENKNVKNKLLRFKKITGETFWASVSASSHFDNSGAADWIDGVFEDVTEKIGIENKLNSYLAFLETLIDTISNPVFYKDTEGVFLGCNRSFSEIIMGLPKHEIINKTVFDLKDQIPAKYAIIYDNQDRELLSNPGVQEHETRIKCADGRYRYYRFSNATYFDPEHKVAGIVGIMTDITQIAENERALRSINEELDLLITSLSSIIIGVSVKDRITHWNPFAEKVFGIKSADVIGKAFYESGIVWDWGIVYEAISESILEERSVRINELNYETPENKNGILGMTINPLKRGGEVLDGFIILGKDLTEQKILEAQLLQSNKLEAIGQLAAGVAHEINTPLQYVGDNLKFLNKSFIGFLNMIDVYQRMSVNINDKNACIKALAEAEKLTQSIKLDFLIEQMPRALEQSTEGVNRVSKIVQSMKAFAHPDTGLKVPANINKAIENTVIVSRNEWKYDCELKLELDPGLPEVPCFESEFNQVILNLIVNAKDAVHEAKINNKIESGLITICTAIENSYVVIKVEDNGTGIPEKIKDRIFDPFFTTKEVGKGTGQGLAISHSIIVEKHNGLLYFSSKLDQGTTFIIKLPIEEKQAGK